MFLTYGASFILIDFMDQLAQALNLRVKILDQLLVAWLGDKSLLRATNLLGSRIFLISNTTTHRLDQYIVLSTLTALGFDGFVLTACTLTIFGTTISDVLLTVYKFLFSQL